MVFSSPIFLFFFLPITLLLYAIAPRRLRNSVLLLASLFFYAWGEKFYLLVMLASIVINYFFGLGIQGVTLPRSKKIVVGLAVTANLAILVSFKYANFIVDNFNELFGPVFDINIPLDSVHLPIGISFFTFQAMSYVIDIYRGEGTVQKNPINLALYISLFPQLIAGPIVRYHDVARQISNRVTTLHLFTSGAERFVIGFAKKVLIANTMGRVADDIFALPLEALNFELAVVGVVAYTFQIYFDFSGYSDMAIGLGRMFGFKFLENFNYPYISRSIQEFWRRWHISLSSWYRDYLYIPLGGSRRGPARTYFNLVLVFLLCGLWHGASWTFVVWGLFHGGFLVFERLVGADRISLVPTIIRRIYTLAVVMSGWILFRSETFTQAVAFFKAIVGAGTGDGSLYHAGLYVDTEVVLIFALAVIASTPIWNTNQVLFRFFGADPLDESHPADKDHNKWSRIAYLLLIFVISVSYLAANTYNPFIYFRF